MSASVYRMFGGDDTLIYVGVSANPLGRAMDHQREKKWWTEVDHIELAHFDTRAEALEAEARAIAEETPLYNRVLPPTDLAVRRQVLPETDEDKFYMPDNVVCVNCGRGVQRIKKGKPIARHRCDGCGCQKVRVHEAVAA